jgi:hypothetical protein
MVPTCVTSLVSPLLLEVMVTSSYSTRGPSRIPRYTCPNVYETRAAQEASCVEFPMDNLFYAVK